MPKLFQFCDKSLLLKINVLELREFIGWRKNGGYVEDGTYLWHSFSHVPLGKTIPCRVEEAWGCHLLS